MFSDVCGNLISQEVTIFAELLKFDGVFGYFKASIEPKMSKRLYRISLTNPTYFSEHSGFKRN